MACYIPAYSLMLISSSVIKKEKFFQSVYIHTLPVPGGPAYVTCTKCELDEFIDIS